MSLRAPRSATRPAGSRLLRARVLAPLLLLLTTGLGALVLVLPWSAMPLPGARRIATAVNRLPLPWKAPRPTYVLAPEGLTYGQPFALETLATLPAPEPRAAPGTSDQGTGRHPVLEQPLPESFKLEGIRHTWQTWNNCGPATITMGASYFGRTESQAHAAQFLKPNPDDKNVTPDELIAYLRSIGLRGDNLYAGSIERLKRLVVQGVPIVISMWYTPSPNDGIGHYRLLTGYDDVARQLIFHDSFQAPGVNVRIGYDDFDEDWRVYSRAYLPIYSAEQSEVVAAIVEGDMDEQYLRQRSLFVAQEELAARQDDPYSWFNAGTALTRNGRTAEATLAFDRARALRLPWRLLWYQFAIFEAYLAESRFSDVLSLADANLAQAPELEESQYFRGRALEGLGRRAEAKAAFEAALRVNPKYAPALHSLSSMS